MVDNVKPAALRSQEASRSRLREATHRLYVRQPLLFGLVVALVVLTVDYFTGRAIQFPIAYVIPVGLAAWNRQRAVAYGGALLLPALRLLFHVPWHETEALSVDLVNLPVAALSLSLYAYLIDRTSRQTQELQKRLRKLEGILQICAACKRIRNPDGSYVQLETYITDHSEALFSHGLCPDCLPKYL
jgi:hypothetical protein